MRILNNFIFFFLIFLSLTGFGNDLSLSKTNVKYLKETEWIARPNSNSKVSKFIHFHLIKFTVSSNLTSQLWEREFRNFYDSKLIVCYLFQTRSFRNRDTTNLITNKQYTPRLFTDDHNVTFRGAELIVQFCTACGITHEVGNSMWNHLLNGEWINQKRKLNIRGRDVLDGCPIGSLLFLLLLC
jgi:hypothetical protein